MENFELLPSSVQQLRCPGTPSISRHGGGSGSGGGGGGGVGGIGGVDGVGGSVVGGGDGVLNLISPRFTRALLRTYKTPRRRRGKRPFLALQCQAGPAGPLSVKHSKLAVAAVPQTLCNTASAGVKHMEISNLESLGKGSGH